MENVKDTLRNYIVEHFEIDADDPDFSDDVHLFDYGFVDSLGATEIVLFLEDHFHIQITQKDITLYAMNTIDEIAEVVERNDSNYESAKYEIAQKVKFMLENDERERAKMGTAARRSSAKAAWKKFIVHYEKAYETALKRRDERLAPKQLTLSVD